MKDRISKKFYGLVIVAIVSGTFIINVLFKIKAPFELLKAEWTAGDALGLFAAISAALIAIYGISLTIKQSDHVFKEEVRNSALPFLNVDFLQSKNSSAWNLVIAEDEGESSVDKTYREEKIDCIYFIIDEKGIDTKGSLNKHQQEVIENGGSYVTPLAGGGRAITHAYSVYIPLSVENVGKGVAINVRVGLNKSSTSASHRRYIVPVSLKVGDYIKVGIFGEGIKEESELFDKYCLEFIYYDIFGNHYEQSYDVDLYYNNEKNCAALGINTSQEQIILERKDDTKNN